MPKGRNKTKKPSNPSMEVQPSKVNLTVGDVGNNGFEERSSHESRSQSKRLRGRQQMVETLPLGLDVSSFQGLSEMFIRSVRLLTVRSDSDKEQPPRKKPKVFNTRDEDSFDDHSEVEATQRPKVALPRVTRSQASRVTIDVDNISEDEQENDDEQDDDDEEDDDLRDGQRGNVQASATQSDEQEVLEPCTPQPSSDGMSDLTPLPSVTTFRKKFLSVEVPRLTSTQRAMYMALAPSMPGTPSASASQVLEMAQRVSASGRTSAKVSVPAPRKPNVLPSEASLVFNPTKTSKAKVPSSFHIKGSTPAGSDDSVFQDQPQSPTESIRFNDLEWGDEDKDWAPPSTNLPDTYKDSAFNHPPPGKAIEKPFLPSPHEKVWIQVGFGRAFGWGRLKRSKHRSNYHDHVSVFNPSTNTYHPLPDGFVPPQPGVIPPLNELPGLAAEKSQQRRGEPGLASQSSQLFTVPMPPMSFKNVDSARSDKRQVSTQEPKELPGRDVQSPSSSTVESAKPGPAKPRTNKVTTVEEPEVDAPPNSLAIAKTVAATVTISNDQGVVQLPIKSSSKGPPSSTSSPVDEDDDGLDTLAPSVRAHKKGKFKSGRLSKAHQLRAEKARDTLLDLSMDSNHSVTHILGSVGLIIGPERELNRWQAAEALYRYDPEAPKEKGPLMKYSRDKYNREKEEHKDDLETWHQTMLAELVEHRANDDLLDSQESAVRNMEIVSQKATHLARQVASVKDIDIVTVLISRDPTASQLASIVSSNTHIQEKIDSEEVWVHESLRNMADAFNALDKSWIKWDDITLGELMMMSLAHHGSASTKTASSAPKSSKAKSNPTNAHSVEDRDIAHAPSTSHNTMSVPNAQPSELAKPSEEINVNKGASDKEDPRGLRSYMKTWKTPFAAADNTFWAPPKEIINMSYEERRDYYRRVVRKRLQVDLAILLDVSKLNDFFLHFLDILVTNRVRCINWPLTSGVPEIDFTGSKQLFGGKGMGDSDTLSLGNAYLYEKPENLPVMFECWTDEELSYAVDSTEFLLVDLVQSRGWDGPKSCAKVIQSAKYMEEWSGSPSHKADAKKYARLNTLTSALHDLDQPMPDSPEPRDGEEDTMVFRPAAPQARRRATKKPHSRAVRQPATISEDEDDDIVEQLPRYTSQPPVAGPSHQAPSHQAPPIPMTCVIPPQASQAIHEASVNPQMHRRTQAQQAIPSNVAAFNPFQPAGHQAHPFQANVAAPSSSFYPQNMPDFAALFAQWMQSQAGAFAAQSQAREPFLQPAATSSRSQDPHFSEDDYNMH
ncbi:hypothetical protein BKA70DRAFT_1235428 [Coprinopsis sp. MPI-PUGE-AT-0042]|nr:hypothetical protein BKA70DRAFT_1235428 [Coprinopsis sp. MPI-PUGE-AT-0042]